MRTLTYWLVTLGLIFFFALIAGLDAEWEAVRGDVTRAER